MHVSHALKPLQDMFIQPVVNLTRQLQNGQRRSRAVSTAARYDGMVPEPQVPGGPPLLPAYLLLRPSIHFLRLVHEWGLQREMGLLFDAVRSPSSPATASRWHLHPAFLALGPSCSGAACFSSPHQPLGSAAPREHRAHGAACVSRWRSRRGLRPGAGLVPVVCGRLGRVDRPPAAIADPVRHHERSRVYQQRPQGRRQHRQQHQPAAARPQQRGALRRRRLAHHTLRRWPRRRQQLVAVGRRPRPRYQVAQRMHARVEGPL